MDHPIAVVEALVEVGIQAKDPPIPAVAGMEHRIVPVRGHLTPDTEGTEVGLDFPLHIRRRIRSTRSEQCILSCSPVLLRNVHTVEIDVPRTWFRRRTGRAALALFERRSLGLDRKTVVVVDLGAFDLDVRERQRRIFVDHPSSIPISLRHVLAVDCGEARVLDLDIRIGMLRGAVIAGNAVSQRSFSPDEIKLCQSMASHMVNAISNAQRHQATLIEIASLKKAQSETRKGMTEAAEQHEQWAQQLEALRAANKDLASREEAAREARNALEIQVATSRAEFETLAERLVILETDLAQAHAKAEAQTLWYEDEAERMRAEWGESVLNVESSQNVLHGMTAGVLVTDQYAVIHDANFAAEILLDLGLEELQSLALPDLSTDDRWQQAVLTASGGEAVRVTIQMGTNTLMCDLAPLLDPDAPQDEEHRLIVILQDVSAEVEEQRSQLEAMATLAHELRTPITTIVSYADMLLAEAAGAIGSAQRKYLTRIKAGAERMASMTDDLIREAGVEEQWSGPQRQSVDVSSLIEDTVAGSHSQLEDRDLSLDLELPDDLPPILADPDHLRHVLAQLLSNACLASTVGGQVSVQAAQSPSALPDREELSLNGDGFVVVSVSDSGGGLSEEALSRVFDRARPSRTPEGLGESGAGLSLVRTLVEAHGGRLWVESERGVGTTFSFVLPVNGVGGRAGQQTEAQILAELEQSEEPA